MLIEALRWTKGLKLMYNRKRPLPIESIKLFFALALNKLLGLNDCLQKINKKLMLLLLSINRHISSSSILLTSELLADIWTMIALTDAFNTNLSSSDFEKI